MARLSTGLLLSISMVSVSPAFAGDLVYTPINPSFGGSPLNSSHLFAVANAQREATASDADDDLTGGGGLTDPGTARNDDADLFVRQLQGRLLSALAGQVTDAIFGDNPQDQGTVQFGSTTVTFSRSLDSIRLTIFDAIDGTTTEIVVPQLVTSSN
ncbi:curli assembly protein CsgF [Aurantimonas marianensis]|uniref:Curli production assembly/transport component CsgF n=1 Tax=Aurantimonas marianensis TaxID=2920428 RepID=A0A9X2KE96_9HYPH|nr:curli assembly protein CsgF [Aurantimonas marianensis]MCP3054444.1 curli assembly protein CsgF [Aurantimonas marianensis]